MIEETIACRNAALSGRLAFLDTGAGVSAIRIFGGTRPASVNTAPATALLVEISLATPAGAVADGTLTLTASASGMIGVSGLATWARVVNRAGSTAFDMDVGDLLSSAECKLSTVDLFAGGLVILSSAALG